MSDIETRLEYDRIWLTLEGGGDVDGPYWCEDSVGDDDVEYATTRALLNDVQNHVREALEAMEKCDRGPLPLYTASSVLRELVHHGVGWARGASRRS